MTRLNLMQLESRETPSILLIKGTLVIHPINEMARKNYIVEVSRVNELIVVTEVSGTLPHGEILTRGPYRMAAYLASDVRDLLIVGSVGYRNFLINNSPLDCVMIGGRARDEFHPGSGRNIIYPGGGRDYLYLENGGFTWSVGPKGDEVYLKAGEATIWAPGARLNYV